jgi:tetratricopeptide (TPR) repeat protein
MDLLLFLAVRLIVPGTAPESANVPQPALANPTTAPACSTMIQPEARVRCLNRRALDEESGGDFAAASRNLEEADRLWQAQPPPPDALRGIILSNLGEMYQQLGRWRDAGDCFQRAMEVSERTLGHDDVHVAYAMVRLASVESMLGDPSRTEELLTTAISMERRAMPGSAVELASALGFMAMLELQKGDHDKARALAAEGVTVAERKSANTPEYAANLTTLAGVYIVAKDSARALPLLNRAIEMLERQLGPEHPRLAQVLMDRALIYDTDGKCALAEADGLRAVAILTREGGPNGINTAWAKTRLSGFYLDDGRINEAEEILPAAVETQRRFYDRPNWRVAASIAELARLRAVQSRAAEAESLYRESLAMFDESAPRNPEAARAMRGYADLLRARGASKREISRLMSKARSIQSTDN